MSNVKHDNDAGLADFMAGWEKRLGENVQLPVGFALIALTNFRRAGGPQHPPGRGHRANGEREGGHGRAPAADR